MGPTNIGGNPGAAIELRKSSDLAVLSNDYFDPGWSTDDVAGADGWLSPFCTEAPVVLGRLSSRRAESLAGRRRGFTSVPPVAMVPEPARSVAQPHGRALVCGGFLCTVDDQQLDGVFGGFELQAELIDDGIEDGAVDVVGRAA